MEKYHCLNEKCGIEITESEFYDNSGLCLSCYMLQEEYEILFDLVLLDNVYIINKVTL